LAFLGRQVLAPGDDLHPERLGNFGGAGAELAEAEDAERQAFEVHADRGLPRHASLHPRVLVADAPGQFEHQADGDARGRAAHGGSTANHDATLLGGGDVDGRITQAGGDQELELRQLLDDGAGKCGALTHGTDDLESLQRRDDLVCCAKVSVEHLDLEVAGNLRPVGHAESDVLVIIENCAAVTRHDWMSVGCPWRWRKRPGGIAPYSTSETVPGRNGAACRRRRAYDACARAMAWSLAARSVRARRRALCSTSRAARPPVRSVRLFPR